MHHYNTRHRASRTVSEAIIEDPISDNQIILAPSTPKAKRHKMLNHSKYTPKTQKIISELSVGKEDHKATYSSLVQLGNSIVNGSSDVISSPILKIYNDSKDAEIQSSVFVKKKKNINIVEVVGVKILQNKYHNGTIVRKILSLGTYSDIIDNIREIKKSLHITDSVISEYIKKKCIELYFKDDKFLPYEKFLTSLFVLLFLEEPFRNKIAYLTNMMILDLIILDDEKYTFQNLLHKLPMSSKGAVASTRFIDQTLSSIVPDYTTYDKSKTAIKNNCADEILSKTHDITRLWGQEILGKNLDAMTQEELRSALNDLIKAYVTDNEASDIDQLLTEIYPTIAIEQEQTCTYINEIVVLETGEV